ncbi:hypothetical protein [Bacillus cereus]
MRVQIINVENDDSKVTPTEYCQLDEVKLMDYQYFNDGSKSQYHYGSDWFCEVDPDGLGHLLVDLEQFEGKLISFANGGKTDIDYIVWIGVEDNPY